MQQSQQLGHQIARLSCCQDISEEISAAYASHSVLLRGLERFLLQFLSCPLNKGDPLVLRPEGYALQPRE